MFPKDPEFYTPLALSCQKEQHLSALEVYKNQSPNFYSSLSRQTWHQLQKSFCNDPFPNDPISELLHILGTCPYVQHLKTQVCPYSHQTFTEVSKLVHWPSWAALASSRGDTEPDAE